ncbi:type II toxin-antitoxin system RelE/ParE family toxin [Xanthobacter autotrophicus]|uniref:type II toxin-antitoxin system RelE/ParE family toxin n=1 Tax=Xanthobacter autotrophicus TaxID=280 RepID=UPI00372D619D
MSHQHPCRSSLFGPVGTVRGTRQLTVSGSPYLVVYRVGDDEVTILAVLHAARQIRS